MSENSLANMILKSAGIYSDEQLSRIAAQRASKHKVVRQFAQNHTASSGS